MKEFLKENPYTFPIGFDEEGKYGNMFNITAIPTTYIVGKDKKISEILIGATDEETLKNYLQEAINK